MRRQSPRATRKQLSQQRRLAAVKRRNYDERLKNARDTYERAIAAAKSAIIGPDEQPLSRTEALGTVRYLRIADRALAAALELPLTQQSRLALSARQLHIAVVGGQLLEDWNITAAEVANVDD